MEGAYARLEGRNFEFYMSKKRISIGRNSKLGDVDVNMGSSRFISRKHLEIFYDRSYFFLLCRGKNGIFVDDVFQRRENKRLQLPNSCIIRFPSTQIKLAFTSLLEDLGPTHPAPPTAVPTPLRVDTTLVSPFVSPMPSPTGTISAVNSCPASPNSEYHRRMPSFDFMAKYASKLLSSATSSSDGEGPGDTNNTEEEEEGSMAPPQTLPPERERPPSNQATNEKEEGPEEEEKSAEKSQLKPPFSYAQLIVQGLLASKDKRQTLSGIYQFIAEKYPYYKLEDKGWKNSIRHNLSLNQYFMKAPREKEGLGFGKGGYWCMHPDYEDKLMTQAYVKRKKKGIPVFPSAGLLSSRSAPPSPTHHPFMHSEFNPRELEAKFAMPTPPTTSHFTLPPFFSQLTASSSSSHSLPASPSRAHPGFSASQLKFFPGVRSSSTEALALEQPRRVPFEPIHEAHEEPAPKRPKIEEREVQAKAGARPAVGKSVSAHLMEGRPIQVPTITSLPAMQPSGVQFLSLPLMASGTNPPQQILSQPLSSFLPQNFFAAPPGGVSSSNNSNDEEG